jgi:hypothetical protein
MIIHTLATVQPAPFGTVLAALLFKFIMLILGDEYRIARAREAMTEACLDVNTRIATTFMTGMTTTHWATESKVIAVGTFVFNLCQVYYCPLIVCHFRLVVRSYSLFSCFWFHMALGIHLLCIHDHRVS